MSQHQVLATVEALLQDPGAGFQAAFDGLKGGAVVPINATLRFVKWKLAGALQPATVANVMLRPRTWAPQLRQGQYRDAQIQLEIGFESFAADPDVLQETITIAAAALMQVLDQLRTYSDAHGGTIIDVIDPTDIQFGEYEGGTSAGFSATVTLEERAAE